MVLRTTGDLYVTQQKYALRKIWLPDTGQSPTSPIGPRAAIDDKAEI